MRAPENRNFVHPVSLCCKNTAMFEKSMDSEVGSNRGGEGAARFVMAKSFNEGADFL